jgi:diguanylate cyclase (GGDEF)-like protein
MPNIQQRPASMHLASLVLVGITGVFATVLVLTTGDLLTLWPLYVVPIVIAALAYHVAGAVLVSALCVAVVAMLLYGTGADTGMLPELVVGMVAFTISGVVIGVQAQRASQHNFLLEEASITDPVSGLYKREFFERRLFEETRRCERYDLTCAIVLVQLQCFDEFKEKFGHYKAELLIEHLGEVLRMSVRDHDVVGRYGPITFALLLPFGTAESAAAVAERLRLLVADTEFEGDVLEPVTHCTVTTALATYPQDGCERDVLLSAAEARLEGAGL